MDEDPRPLEKYTEEDPSSGSTTDSSDSPGAATPRMLTPIELEEFKIPDESDLLLLKNKQLEKQNKQLGGMLRQMTTELNKASDDRDKLKKQVQQLKRQLEQEQKDLEQVDECDCVVQLAPKLRI